MRRFHVVALLACLVAAVSTAAFGAEEKAATSHGKMMKPATTAAMSDSALQEKLVAMENKIFEAYKNKDVDGFKNMVALKVKLGLARAVAQKDPARAKELIGQLFVGRTQLVKQRPKRGAMRHHNFMHPVVLLRCQLDSFEHEGQ